MPGRRVARGYVTRERTRPLRCPQCGWRVLDAIGDTRIRLFTLPDERSPDFIVKCGRCGSEIGAIKIK